MAAEDLVRDPISRGPSRCRQSCSGTELMSKMKTPLHQPATARVPMAKLGTWRWSYVAHEREKSAKVLRCTYRALDAFPSPEASGIVRFCVVLIPIRNLPSFWLSSIWNLVRTHHLGWTSPDAQHRALVCDDEVTLT